MQSRAAGAAELRELEIRRKEFAYLVLTGASTGMSDARAALARTGLRNCRTGYLWRSGRPARAFPASTPIASSPPYCTPSTKSASALIMWFTRPFAAAAFACSCTSDRLAPAVWGLNAQELAQAILDAWPSAVPCVCASASRQQERFSRLGESYHEACVALSITEAVIAVYRASSVPECEATLLAAQIPELLKERRFEEARLALHSLPINVERQFGLDLAVEKRVLLSTLGAMLSAGQSLGCDPAVLAELRKKASESLGRATNPFEVQDGYSQLAEAILDEIRQMYLDKGSRLVDRVCRLVERSIAEGTTMTQTSLAQALRISTGHLSRVFRQTTGDTFERYVMRRRVEVARRLLLDPAHNVSSVARQCGFKDASYFARVFRRIVGSSPAEYSRRPVNALQTNRSAEYLPTSGRPLR